MAKKKAPGLAGAGAEVEVGITDTQDCNTDPSNLSTHESEDGVLPIKSAFGEDDDVADSSIPSDAGVASGDDDAKSVKKTMSKTMMAAANQARPRRASYVETIVGIARDYLDNLDPANLPTSEEAESRLTEEIFHGIELRNTNALKEDRWTVPRELPDNVLAMCMRKVDRVCLVEVIPGDPKSQAVAYYDPETGSYEVGEEAVDAIITRYRSGLPDPPRRSIFRYIREQCRAAGEIKHIYKGTRYMRHHDGWFDSETGQNIPHTPKLVEIRRPTEAVDLNAPLPTFTAPDGFTWNIEDAMLELADGDEEVCELLWMGVAATCMPRLPWYQVFGLTAESGNNGKGMYCDFLESIAGPANTLAKSITDFQGNFDLGGIERYALIVGHENEPKGRIKAPAKFKSIVTQNTTRSEEKWQAPRNTKFLGFIVQCFNRLPIVDDTSESWLRRILPIRFKHCYTGVERKYIGLEWIVDPRTVRYAMRRVAEMMMAGKVTGTFPVPADVKRELREMDRFNSPVANFALDVLPKLQLSVLPKELVYDLYVGWLSSEERSRNPLGSNKFWMEFKDVIRRYGPQLGFECVELDAKHRRRIPSGEFKVSEPLLSDYRVSTWADMRAEGYAFVAGDTLSMKHKDRKYASLLVRTAPAPDGDDDPDGGPDDGAPAGTSDPVADMELPDGAAYVLEDPDERSMMMRDAYDEYLGVFGAMDAAVKAGTREVDRTREHGMYRGWREGGTWRVSRYHPDVGEWIPVAYDEKPPDADMPLQYGCWLNHRLGCVHADGYTCDVVDIALHGGKRE